MSEQISMALAFLQSHPESAAKILEQHEIDEVSAFFTRIPLPYAKPVFRQMMPKYTAQLCQKLGREFAIDILSDMEINQVSLVLRYIDKKRRSELLKALPPTMQMGCALMLNYDQDAIGAWMTPHVVTVPSDYTVEKARGHMQTVADISYADYIFVIGSDRTLVARIHVAQLLRANGQAPITSLMEKNCKALSARLSMRIASENEQWMTSDALPVHDRAHQFIGVLRHVDLRKGLDNLATKSETNSMQPNGMHRVYTDTLLELFYSIEQFVESDLLDRERSAR